MKNMKVIVIEDVLVPLSSRAKSGYMYVSHGKRTKKPWVARYQGYRSSGFSQPVEAALHLARYVASADAVPVRPKNTATRNRTKKSTTNKAPKPLATSSCTHVTPTISKPATDSLPPPAAWMDKPNVRFAQDRCALFGRRLSMRRGKQWFPAVVKAWTPYAKAQFSIVFDDIKTVFVEDLFRRGRNDWKVVEWEDDIWSTSDLRPMCPQCGHPLGEGNEAWTLCTKCGFNEPGVSSTAMLSRLRTADPFRNLAIDYHVDGEGDEQDDAV